MASNFSKSGLSHRKIAKKVFEKQLSEMKIEKSCAPRFDLQDPGDQKAGVHDLVSALRTVDGDFLPCRRRDERGRYDDDRRRRDTRIRKLYRQWAVEKRMERERSNGV